MFEREEWRNARTMARVRAAGWAGLGAVGLVIDFGFLGRPNPASLIALAWGVVSAVLAAVVFRHVGPRRGDLLRAVLVTFDLTVLAVVFDMGQRFLGGTSQGLHSLFGMALAAAVLIISNVLNASFRPMLWSVLYGGAMYLVLLWRHGALDFMAALDVGLLIALTAVFFYASGNLRRGLRTAAEREALARFLPAQLVDLVAHDPSALELGGVEQEATILFADIRDFTHLSERMDPSEIVSMLNEYFGEMVDELFRFGGTLDKFIGDGICAVFGAPLPQQEQARNAVTCALAMVNRLELLNERRAKRNQEPIRIGIGVHTGRVIAGNIGSRLRLEYTHIGDAVNTASRIESLTKAMGAALLVSAQTFERAGGSAAFDARKLEPVQVKGKAQPLELYAVEGSAAPSSRRAS